MHLSVGRRFRPIIDIFFALNELRGANTMANKKGNNPRTSAFAFTALVHADVQNDMQSEGENRQIRVSHCTSYA